MKEAFNTLSSVLSKRSLDAVDKEDECDLYGKLLSKKLKRLPEGEREEVMYEIDGLLLQKIRSRNINNNSWYADPPLSSHDSSNQSITSSPTPSPYSAPSSLQIQHANPTLTSLDTYYAPAARNIHTVKEPSSVVVTSQARHQPQPSTSSKILLLSNDVIVSPNKNLISYAYNRHHSEVNETDQGY